VKRQGWGRRSLVLIQGGGSVKQFLLWWNLGGFIRGLLHDGTKNEKEEKEGAEERREEGDSKLRDEK